MTQSQIARQERMIDVASRLAAEGGFDAVQMRAVAAEADVALGTLYRYFPSKEHLLVSAMLRQIDGLADAVRARPAVGDAPVERVNDVLRRATGALQRNPKFTVAVLRALVSGDETVAPVVRQVREAMNAIVLESIGRGEPTDDDIAVADLLSEVWLSVLVGWIGGVLPASSIMQKMQEATRRLLVG